MPDTMTNDNLEKALYKFMEEANSYGITGITNITQGGLDIIDMYHKVEREGNLTLRMRVVPTMKEGRTYDEVLSTIKSYNDSATDMISSNTVKIFYDGVTERGTAVFLEPYLESTGLGDHWCGEPIWSQEDFTRLVHDFDAEGVQVHVHAWATAPFTAPLMPSRRLGRPMGSATRGTRSPTYAPLPMRISSAWPIWM